MQQQFEGYLFLHNIAKPKNIGTIIRNAAAFNLTKVFMIGKQGQNKKKFQIAEGFSFFGNHGTFDQMNFHLFNNLKEAKEYFVQNNIYVCGVEIGEGSQNIIKNPFKGHTVFFLGNEGTGLIPEHKAICDQFVYIPQYTQKTASLNVGVASGIIFHHFAQWAGFQEQKVEGEKFLDPEKQKQEKERKKQEMIEQGKKLKKQKLEQQGVYQQQQNNNEQDKVENENNNEQDKVENENNNIQ
ncbi:unnamed protein product [Paramecium sonneborni]|uniref:tRNA/rRNA methyltransferase SpoU type domain-containing protein n=1 Tax=Paramecium sonneborni TaxID=65129 RepID=A0A8S1R3D4_9CILI|nr:unnamed protein product [Paramecium sonneborni]